MNASASEETLLPIADARSTWRALRRLGRPHRLLATAAFGSLLGGTASGLLIPPILGHIVDAVIDHQRPAAVTMPFVLLLGVAGLQAILGALGDISVARLGETMLSTLRERVVVRALEMPLEQVERAGSGDLVSRVSGDVSLIASAVRSAIPAIAGAALTIALTIAGLAVLDWRFAVAGLLAAPIQLHTVRWYLARSTPLYAAERVAEGARTQQLLDSVGGRQTVRAFRLTVPHVAAVRARSQAALDYSLAGNRLATRFFGRLNSAEFVGLAAIMVTGFWLVGGGAVTVGSAAAAALYFHRLFDPVNNLLGLFGTAQEAAAGLARLVGIADASDADCNLSSIPTHRPRAVTVAVEHVSFSYTQGHSVLHDVNVGIEAGQRVALVGASGAGKTTLAKLVAGIHQPSTGTVAIGDVDARAADPTVLRRQVGLITQEVHVFAGSLAEDLRLAKPDATDDELRAALTVVGAQRWVDLLPAGLSTIVGEGGHQLSATQAQAVALARLVLADPPVVILDEASADAGSAGARELDRAADDVLGGRTALVVAHRLSQAAAADRVVLLEAGRVAEAGTHRELLDADGGYARLWASWSGAGALIDGPRCAKAPELDDEPRAR